MVPGGMGVFPNPAPGPHHNTATAPKMRIAPMSVMGPAGMVDFVFIDMSLRFMNELWADRPYIRNSMRSRFPFHFSGRVRVRKKQ